MYQLKVLSLIVVLSTAGYTVLAQTPADQPNSFTLPATDSSTRFEKSVKPISAEARAEARRLYKEGVKYGLASLFPQAAEIFLRVIKLDPEFADAYQSLGHAYLDMRQWHLATESLQRAVELNPEDGEARARLAEARRMLEREGVPGPALRDPAKSTESDADGVSVAMNVSSTSAARRTSRAVIDETNLTRIYRVGPGDVLDVRFKDSDSQSTLFTVTPAGLLEHPLLADAIPVTGLTVEEISDIVEAELKRRQLVSQKVSVGVRDYSSHTILVSGLVREPGTKILRREAIPLYVVVADAQPLPDAASVSVIRSEFDQTYEIDLTQPKEMNLLIRPGDVITVQAHVTQFVYVGGEVKSPGEIRFRRGLTLTQAIIAAGGGISKLKEARIGRENGHGFLNLTRFRLKEIESGKIPDPLVQPGDRITVLR